MRTRAFVAALSAMSPSWAQSVADASSQAFGFPSPLLAATERRAFSVGNALFRTNWVTAPASAAGVDGLGPLFNARSCSTCHLHDGRSRPPEPGESDRSGLLVRIGVRTADGPDAPHPVFGEQIQDAAVAGVAPEATVEITWRTLRGAYGDGEVFELVAPEYGLRDLAYGALGSGTALGGRTAPHLIGLGLLEAVPDATLLAAADPGDRDGDGVSGRVHVVAAPGGGTAIGRFGWKATQPTVLAQTAAAFANDMGITSSLHPDERLSAVERAVIVFTSGGEPEIDDDKLGRVVFYARTLAVPEARDAGAPAVVAGGELFRSFGCAACHTPELRTAAVAFHPAFGDRTIHPFTDLLLHDMGPDLADGKHDGDAAPAEWRTAPLWGIGLISVVNGHERLLHDGRARGVAEAILWHGGEAERARERFRTAPRERRDELIAFVRSR
ncbi:MAG: thiol oxidoreductase [Planctomycetes bacterium]|nr:thiol oxidoreductase [Planctomycetota bacterium]